MSDKYNQIKQTWKIKSILNEAANNWKQSYGCYPTIGEFEQMINGFLDHDLFQINESADEQFISDKLINVYTHKIVALMEDEAYIPNKEQREAKLDAQAEKKRIADITDARGAEARSKPVPVQTPAQKAAASTELDLARFNAQVPNPIDTAKKAAEAAQDIPIKFPAAQPTESLPALKLDASTQKGRAAVASSKKTADKQTAVNTGTESRGVRNKALTLGGVLGNVALGIAAGQILPRVIPKGTPEPVRDALTYGGQGMAYTALGQPKGRSIQTGVLGGFGAAIGAKLGNTEFGKKFGIDHDTGATIGGVGGMVAGQFAPVSKYAEKLSSKITPSFLTKSPLKRFLAPIAAGAAVLGLGDNVQANDAMAGLNPLEILGGSSISSASEGPDYDNFGNFIGPDYTETEEYKLETKKIEDAKQQQNNNGKRIIQC